MVKKAKKAKKTVKKAAGQKRKQVCGHPGCGKTGHNARAHAPGGRLA
jgi:hypothetical protein